jgi:hypothetical protein
MLSDIRLIVNKFSAVTLNDSVHVIMEIVAMLSVIIQSTIMLSVIMLNVILLVNCV